MKLVQLLAKELKEWPENIEFLAQDSSGGVFGWIGRPEYYDDQWILNGDCDIVGFDVVAIDISDDYKSSLVTKLQWQAEREKMNKPKWIRHRGGRMPVGEATIVDVRLRCGDIQKHEACEFLWRHKDCDSAVNIMAYRVIEETKDQEIEEVKKTNFGTITYKLEIDATEATKEIDSLVAKWGQIESPLKWRDEIIELEAYEEEFRREREKLIRKLESEGFKLIDHAATVYGDQIIDLSDWRNWQAGDVIEIVANEGAHEFKNGEEVIVVFLDIEDAEMNVKAEYKDGSDYWWLSGTDAKFIRRP